MTTARSNRTTLDNTESDMDSNSDLNSVTTFENSVPASPMHPQKNKIHPAKAKADEISDLASNLAKNLSNANTVQELDRELLETSNSMRNLDKEKCQGVVIVLENITEERIRQSAIQRYQKRLNEMESQVQDYAELRNKLQVSEIFGQ